MAGLLSAVESERDARLLAEHRDGDAAAFAELYELHYGRLLRSVRHRVRDWYVAEEIVQEAFVRAYRASAHLKDGSRFYPWLTVIAQRLAIDYFRRIGRVSPVAEFELELELGEEAPADEGLIADCETEALRAAMARVRERHRQVLDWQGEGLSYEDIAQRLNAPLTTVPPLLFRARQALRREYLALMEAERIAAVPVLGAVVAWSRRWRARGLTLANYMPEPAMLTAQIAGAVIVVASGFGPFAGPFSSVVDLQPGDAAAAFAELSQLGGTSSSQTDSNAPESVHHSPSGDRDAQLVDKTVPYVRVDRSAHDRGRAQARRDAPYFFEVGPAWFALDPEGDAQHMSDLVNDEASLP